MFDRYENGLRVLHKEVEEKYPNYFREFLVYEQRLTENIIQSRRFGDTREREASRAEIIDGLNQLARSTTGKTFNDVCTNNVYHRDKPISNLPSYDQILTAFHTANAELRNYNARIADIHLERAEVTQIVEWVLHTDSQKKLCMLLDQPGSGKTVVMRDVLVQLEAMDKPVLAIKADNLSGVKTADDLTQRLQLPACVEDCVRTMASTGTCVVLLDQIDALSLALARDMKTLDLIVSLLERLRSLPNVCIVASCRTFDLHNDPKLSSITPDQQFRLQPLNEDQINQILNRWGISLAQLQPAHKELLKTPLHLQVYAKIIDNLDPEKPEPFYSLQELYRKLWWNYIEHAQLEAPASNVYVEAIYTLVDVMQQRQNQQLAVPEAVLDQYPGHVKQYLQRIDFIRQEGCNLLFFHQTFFDYCYARRFVAQGYALCQEIKNSSQGLFERSKMIQILAYLRGADRDTYLREVRCLLFEKGLRIHLRLLLIGWLGSLPNPADDERQQIVRRLLRDSEDRKQFLIAARGNSNWFDKLQTHLLPELLQTDDNDLLNTMITYLSSLITQCTDVILSYLMPYFNRSDVWNARIVFCLSELENWHHTGAIRLLCNFLQQRPADISISDGTISIPYSGFLENCLQKLTDSNPVESCQVVRIYLDKWLDAVKTTNLHHNSIWNQSQSISTYVIIEILIHAVRDYPEQVLEHILPWFVHAASLVKSTSADRYPSSVLFPNNWYSEHTTKDVQFVKVLVEALQYLALNQPDEFRAKADDLAKSESSLIHRVLVHAYLVTPQVYIQDIVDYLLADNRRFNLGEDLEYPEYESCLLVKEAFIYGDKQHRTHLEQVLLELYPPWELLSRNFHPSTENMVGLTQLNFLKTIPVETLSPQAQRRRQELERKFPCWEPHVPQGIRVFFSQKSPVPEEAHARMSDDNWLKAMVIYGDVNNHCRVKNLLEGNIHGLAGALQEQVKQYPERFYRLAQRFDDTISLHYVAATLRGLSESDAPADWIFELVRKFATKIEEYFRREICRILEKRAKDDIPDDLLDLMTDWALSDPDPVQDDGTDPIVQGINSNRGVAVQIVCYCAMYRQNPQHERAFALLEKAALDTTDAVRICVVERLRYLIQYDEDRAISIFETILHEHHQLLAHRFVHDFLHATYRHHFARTCYLMEAMLDSHDDEARQTGAGLVCLAAFDYREAEELAERAISGDTAMRRGAAQVYAHNLHNPEIQEVCKIKLLQLINDSDYQVRQHTSECFQHLQLEHLDYVYSLIEEFLLSPSLPAGINNLVTYLKEKEVAVKYPTLVLDAIDLSLEVITNSQEFDQSHIYQLRRDLVSLPLAVYRYSADSKVQSSAMELFERLLLMNIPEAKKALEEYDRR